MKNLVGLLLMSAASAAATSELLKVLIAIDIQHAWTLCGLYLSAVGVGWFVRRSGNKE